MKLWGAVMLSAGIVLAGCGEKEEGHRLTVVTSFYPMYTMTSNLVKDVPGAKLVNLAPPSVGCLHDYQMTPQDMKILSQADVFVINGAGMESFKDKAVKLNPKMTVIDASRGVDLIKDNGNANPHIFASISGAIQQVRNTAAGMEKADPQHTALYRMNAAVYTAKLDSLRDRMHKALQNIKGREIITFHEAFPYFAREFGLRIAAVVEREPGSEPSAGELAATIELVKKKKIKALFIEPQYPAKSAETVARETGAKVFTLDPAVTGPVDPEAYLKIMEGNLKVLKEALD